jgi:hypothetical protein
MAKDKSFAAKLAKSSGTLSTHCSDCGEVRSPLFVVANVKDETKGTVKFKENFVGICKCNQNEVMK